MSEYRGDSFSLVSLKEIKDIKTFISQDGTARCNLYNSTGSLLIAKGKPIPAKVYSITAFADKGEFPDQPIPVKPAPAGDNIKTAETAETVKSASQSFVLDKKAKDLYDRSIAQAQSIYSQDMPMSERVERAYGIVDDTINSDLNALNTCIFALRSKDTYTYNHCLSVYTIMISALKTFTEHQQEDAFWDTFKTQCIKVNFSPPSLRKYGVGAILHDFGKTHIPDSILNKPGRLSEEEFTLMKKHPGLGVALLEQAGITDREILQMVGNHHPGYILYRGEEQNPLVSICSIIDIYDALRAKRAYKDPLDWPETKAILIEEKTKNGWDPFIFNTLVQEVFEGLEKDRQKIKETQKQTQVS